MAKHRISGEEEKKKNGILKLKIVVEKLQKTITPLLPFSSNGVYHVPKDVKEGHFAVIAEDEDEVKRFVIPLSYLTHPSFMRLLELSAEVYGFDREGALTVPCSPMELERILVEEREFS